MVGWWVVRGGLKYVRKKSQYKRAMLVVCGIHSPVTVPCTIEPFLSSIVTDSLLSFIRNLRMQRSREILG